MRLVACDRCHVHLSEKATFLARMLYSVKSLELCGDCHRKWLDTARDLRAQETQYLHFDPPATPVVP